MSLKDLVKQALLGIGLDVRFAARYDAKTMQRRLLADVSVRTVVDAGAYHGEYTDFARQAFPDAEVYAFEPYPYSARMFAERHGKDARVHLTSAALGDFSGTAILHVSRLPTWNSLLPTSDGSSIDDPKWVETVQKIEVPVQTLDLFAAERKCERIHLLKMDVQGAESKVLLGAVDLLGRGAIDVIYSEVVFHQVYGGGGYPFEICAVLNRYNYGLFGVYNLDLHRSGRMLQADVIFTSPNLTKRMSS